MDTQTVVRILGVDPGGTTGLVCLELPSGSRDLRNAVWIGSAAVNTPDQRKAESLPESQLRHIGRLHEAVVGWRYDYVVFEDPVDGMKWSGAARGTSYALGRTYALCLVGLSRLFGGGQPTRLYSYPVEGNRKRPGWMPKVRGGRNGNMIHIMRREDLLGLLKRMAEALPGRRMAELSEHELMAFGVLRYHIETNGA